MIYHVLPDFGSCQYPDAPVTALGPLKASNWFNPRLLHMRDQPGPTAAYKSHGSLKYVRFVLTTKRSLGDQVFQLLEG